MRPSPRSLAAAAEAAADTVAKAKSAKGASDTAAVPALRPAAPADASALSALILSHLATLSATPDGAAGEAFVASVSESAERSYLESDRYAFTVAEVEGRIAGFIAVRDGCHLFHLFVARAQWGRGIARALWRHALLTSADPGLRWTVNASLTAQAVYRRFGFCDAGPPVEVHGVAFVPMVRALGTTQP